MLFTIVGSGLLTMSAGWVAGSRLCTSSLDAGGWGSHTVSGVGGFGSILETLISFGLHLSHLVLVGGEGFLTGSGTYRHLSLQENQMGLF